ncbi:MAG TPA: immunoglobulin domain-containing protein [Verrucomicrobiae bacterium]|nr:immunoglobulin domain-containing protein [Verrucomicrobiae bacterium]
MKTGMQSLIGLCLVGYCLLFPASSVDGRPFGGFLCVSNFNFNGNNTLVDSFNSSNFTQSVWQTNWSYNGQYYGTYTSSRRTAVATLGTDGSIIQVGDAQIYGYVDTAPGGGVSIQRNGSVGDLPWVDGGNPGIEPGHQYDDMNIHLSDVVLPNPQNFWYTTWLTLPKLATSVIIGGIAYDYVITNIVGKPGTPTNQIYWQLSSMNKGDSLMVNASNVVLYLPGGITMKTGDNLSLNTNSSVSIYTGASIDTGNGLVNNSTQYAPPFRIYGLPAGVDSSGDNVSGCYSIIFGANATLTTRLYAPEASLAFNGGGSAHYDVVGTFACHDLQVNGHYNFHLDSIFNTNLPTPPSIYSFSSNQIVSAGSDATFRVSAFGDAPLYYQWFLNQTNPVAGDTNFSALSLTNVQPTDAGNYSVIVTNLYGSVTSAPASLVVYTNATPTMSVDAASTNGQFQLDVFGVTGLNYSVQASTNLIDWVPLTTNVSPFSFMDTNTALFPQRFYRSVLTP